MNCRAQIMILVGLTACATADPEPSAAQRTIEEALRGLEPDSSPAAGRSNSAASPSARDPSIEILPNGARLVAVERPRLPLVTVAIYSRSGRCADGEQAGRTQLAMRHLFKGHTDSSGKRWSENSVEQHMDSMGAQVHAETDSEWSRVSLSVPQTDRTAEHVDFLFDAWTAPTIDNQIFARERQRTLNELERWERDPGYLGEMAYRSALLGGHPYQLGYGYGTRDTLAGLDPRHIETRLSALRSPAVVTVFVVGPESANVLDRVRHRLAALPASAPGTAKISAPAPTKAQLVEVARPEMDQIGLTFGALGDAATSEDRIPFEVMTRMLTGGFTSALIDELRVNRGLTYGISLRQQWLGQRSPFAFRTSTRAEKAHELLTVAFAELAALARGEFDQQLLETAKNLLATDLASATETQLGTADAMFVGLLHFEDPMRYAKQLSRITAVSRDDILRVAKQLDPARLTIVAVGDASRLRAADLGTVLRSASADHPR